MADIFLSYSKSDHALARKLSAFLESEGWSVWWDKSLGAADHYRDEIMKQLVAARAVITIWSPNSIQSDWVRAEAGRAKADGKLVPLKTSELTYADMPLPFGEMHIENVTSTELIRAAIVAQLSKPASLQAPFWQVTGTFKYQVLTWVGIVGSAITVFANLQGVLDLADWASELVSHWHEWNQIIWGWVFSLIRVKLPRPLVPLISFSVFTAILIVGVNRAERSVTTLRERGKGDHGKRKLAVTLRRIWMDGIVGRPRPEDLHTPAKLGRLIAGIFLYLLMIFAFSLISQMITPITGTTFLGDKVVYELIYSMWVFVLPTSYLLYVVKEQRLWVLAASVLFLFMALFLLWRPLADLGLENFKTRLVFIMFPTFLMVAILFSPPQQLTRRLVFVVLGVLTLVVLSEISQLNLHQYVKPPKVSANFGVAPS
jgi:hypothetical protein